MQTLDWIILIGTLIFIVVYGTWKSRGSKNVKDYIRGGNDAKWWTVGLSVMATQASAITFLSTPGQAFHSGMGFVQFYFGLPIAMLFICLVFIPLYHKLNVYTAYEYLESRFDLKTRVLTAIFFLLQRGLAAGITIFAPSIVLSAVLGWNITILNIIIGILVIIYTVSGGTKAVNVTQKQQMAIIFSGMFVAFIIIFKLLPEGITFSKALAIATVHNKMEILDFSFDFNNRYTVWSGLIGGTFLALSYFGTDQSQVQRYISAKSIKESQLGMLFNGLLKIPMQFFILFIGVMVFVFYQFNPAPLNFNPAAQNAVMSVPEQAKEYQILEQDLKELQQQKAQNIYSFLTQEDKKSTNTTTHYAATLQAAQLKEKNVRDKAKSVIKKANPAVETNDKDYVFIHFILNNLPRGLIGLLLAMILSAAMSSTASELNALAATTTIDLYKRNRITTNDEQHYVKVAKLFTLAWGIIAIVVACYANLFDNLIQLVNIIGSIFYGNILGIFLLAFFIPFVKSTAVFSAAVITQCIVFYVWYIAIMPFLWLNVFGCVLVMLLAMILQVLNPKT